MKMMQQEGDFRPIALVLETPEEAAALWDLMLGVKRTTENETVYQMAVKISDWISNRAHL